MYACMNEFLAKSLSLTLSVAVARRWSFGIRFLFQTKGKPIQRAAGEILSVVCGGGGSAITRLYGALLVVGGLVR